MGSGASSVVYSAYRVRDRAPVAVKIIKKERNCPGMCLCDMHVKLKQEVRPLSSARATWARRRPMPAACPPHARLFLWPTHARHRRCRCRRRCPPVPPLGGHIEAAGPPQHLPPLQRLRDRGAGAAWVQTGRRHEQTGRAPEHRARTPYATRSLAHALRTPCARPLPALAWPCRAQCVRSACAVRAQ
jgi:hypothetical protein